MRKKSFFLILIGGLLVLLNRNLITYAEASSTISPDQNPNAEILYSVLKVKSEKEIDDSASFFDLAAKPGETITIKARIFNASNEDIKVKSLPLTTFTTSNGEIAYSSSPPKGGFDVSLKKKFADIAKTSNSILVPKLGQVETSLQFTVPKDTPNGVILGSWYFEKSSQVNAKEKKGLTINNKYSYALAVKVTVNNEVTSPNLNLIEIKPSLKNYRKVINIEVQNDQPAIVSKLVFDAEVTEKGSDKVLYKNNKGEVTMAPNSNFSYPVFLGQEQLQPGKYTMHLKAKTTDPKWNSKSWKWEKDFQISSKQARTLNKTATSDPKQESNLYGIIIAVAILLVIIIVLIVWQIAKKKYQKR
ncbi:MAG: DUF916 and DUF3324 domain-containing protein [Enterococcus devriesei]|uniref:DUF916 and DUF3324 domain-containing protein n=1 Tax=Enterococcus devriesei TaxID=319970 RepID=UPI003F9054AF